MENDVAENEKEATAKYTKSLSQTSELYLYTVVSLAIDYTYTL